MPSASMSRPTVRQRPRPAARALTVTMTVALLLCAIPAAAQTKPAGPALSTAGAQAYERLQANDIAGAIALLEPLHARGEATAVDLGMLGTLYLETGRAGEALAVLRPMADGEKADAAVLFNAGRAALATGDAAAGERYLERSVARLPISPAARELGLLRGVQGRIVEAFQLLRPWVARNPRDTEARMAAALCALQLERPAEAELLLEGLPPSQPKVAILRGQLLIQKRDPAGAIAVFEPLLENHPQEVSNDLMRLAADAYLAAGRAQDAVNLLRGKTNGPRRLLLLAEALYRTGELEAALATLKPIAEPLLAIDVAGRQPMIDTVTEYGRLLVAAGRHAQALPYLEKATASDPERALAWKSLGEALVATGRRDEGQEALGRFRDLTSQESEQRRVSQLAAQDPAGSVMLQAQQALARGETQRALALVRQEVALSPSDIRPRLLQVRILLALDRLDDALATAETMIAAFPDNPDARYARGAVLLGLDRRADAERDFRQALTLFPDHVPAMSDLALLLMVRGDRPEARALLERVLELRPEDTRAAENLARLEG